MVRLRHRPAIESAGTKTPHLLRNSPDFYTDRKPWWDCEPVLQSKEQERKPLTYSGARPISIPVGPAICNVSNVGEGKDEMTKASIDLQDLRRRIYVKAKAEPSWRFWGLYVHGCKMETLRAAY